MKKNFIIDRIDTKIRNQNKKTQKLKNNKKR